MKLAAVNGNVLIRYRLERARDYWLLVPLPA